jgi:hypothetical protein
MRFFPPLDQRLVETTNNMTLLWGHRYRVASGHTLVMTTPADGQSIQLVPDAGLSWATIAPSITEPAGWTIVGIPVATTSGVVTYVAKASNSTITAHAL